MNAKGSFTVEASIMVPLLLMMTVLFVYLGIYVYDKVLMEQDLDTAVSLVRDRCMYDERKTTDILEDYFSDVCNEHPYLALDNICMSINQRGDRTSISITGEWEIPIYKTVERRIESTREFKYMNPVGVMYLTENVEHLLEEDDEDQDDIRTQ